MDLPTPMRSAGAPTPPMPPRSPCRGDCIDADPHDGYDVCAYDPGFALRRIYYDVCGHAPPRGTVQDIQARHASGGSVFPDLHAALDECLMTEAWRGRDGRVWRMGHERIRPLKAISSKPSDPGPIQLADYDADFALFVYAQIGDHDARDMLLFTDFVRAQTVDGQTTYEPYEVGTVTETLLSIFFGQTEVGDAQFVSPEYRAGLLTHRWFLMLNTMFSSVPRTSAAQAYRAYLGYDLAKLEGLAPVDGEPVDYDAKGVAEPECSVCHSTLDPLAYPFSRYEGIGGGINGPEDQCDGVPGVRLPFVYNDDRMDAFVEVDGDRVADTPESGVLFGQPVADLREWAEVAANSDAFADQLVTMWWTELVGRAPRPDEGEIVRALSDELRFVHGYSVERMLHDLVLTEAYGAP